MPVSKTKRSIFSLYMLCAFGAATLLSGCAYFDAPDPTAEQIDLLAEDAVEPEMREPIQRIDFVDAANRASGGNVEIYSFDKAVAGNAVLSPISSGGGRSTISNPSVQVFSLDDGAPVTRATQPGSPVPAVPVAPVEVEGSDLHSSAAPSPMPAMQPGDVTHIYFAHNSAKLDAGDEVALSDVATTTGGAPLKVSGFSSMTSTIADPVARKIANLKMSMTRALAVTKSLIIGGVPAESIETTAYGEAHDMRAMDGLDAEAASRRVDVAPR